MRENNKCHQIKMKQTSYDQLILQSAEEDDWKLRNQPETLNYIIHNKHWNNKTVNMQVCVCESVCVCYDICLD